MASTLDDGEAVLALDDAEGVRCGKVGGQQHGVALNALLEKSSPGAGGPTSLEAKPLFHSGRYTCTAECIESLRNKACSPREWIQPTL